MVDRMSKDIFDTIGRVCNGVGSLQEGEEVGDFIDDLCRHVKGLAIGWHDLDNHRAVVGDDFEHCSFGRCVAAKALIEGWGSDG